MSFLDNIVDDDLAPARHWIAESLLKVLAFFGLALGGGQAAAAADIALLQQAAFEESPVQPLSPAELALGRLRGITAPFDYVGEAKRSGVDADRLQFMEDITGEPPGLMQLLELWRRGKIPTDLLERGIRQSRVRDEWIQHVEELQYQPPGPGEVIAGWVESHLSEDEAHQLLREAGVDPKDHGWLYDTHGRPPAAGEMIQLMHRGLASLDEVKQAIRESDIKNKYIDRIIQAGVYIPPVRTIGVLVSSGALSDERALQLYAENGVRPDDAAAYLAAAHHGRTATHKALAVGEISTLYEERYVSHDDAVASLVGLGYDANDAGLVLEIADLRRWRKFLDSAISKVRALFIGHKMTDLAAGSYLDQLGVAPEQKADLLALWQLERDANVRLLTPAQVVKATGEGILNPDEGLAELMEMGYSQRDASILMQL